MSVACNFLTSSIKLSVGDTFLIFFFVFCHPQENLLRYNFKFTISFLFSCLIETTHIIFSRSHSERKKRNRVNISICLQQIDSNLAERYNVHTHLFSHVLYAQNRRVLFDGTLSGKTIFKEIFYSTACKLVVLGLRLNIPTLFHCFYLKRLQSHGYKNILINTNLQTDFCS